ncbi:Cell wall-binding protein YocH precursor [Poriferisphaera corsica]|uniref:Cell wall-binding protein YocH n=2 Tax=Poriferisphaera corsica TaxID=2528020 RepID=A0A517YRZ5_9BACT|nr:Cell wall-binding protein YocH precursor [Poriferisphaera corsica]
MEGPIPGNTNVAHGWAVYYGRIGETQLNREKERRENVRAHEGVVSPLLVIGLVFASLSLLAVCVYKVRGAVQGEGSGVGTVSLMAVVPEQEETHVLEYYMPEAFGEVVSNEAIDEVEVDAEPELQLIESWDEEYLMFDGKMMRKKGTLRMKVTAYSPDYRSCGKWADGITASGKSVETNGGNLVAADTRLLPFGTVLTIPGYNQGHPVQVLDRGGKIKENRLDVLYPTHEIALKWGVQNLEVEVWESAE